MSVWQCSWNNKITDRPTGGMPPVANLAQTPNEFPDVRLHGRIEPDFGQRCILQAKEIKETKPY